MLLLGYGLFHSPGDCLAQNNEQPLHGQPWAFGHSSDRKSAIWQKGVAGETIKKNARPQNRKKPTPDTTASIDNALRAADKNARNKALGLSVENESTSWKVAPQQKAMRPDEDHVRERRHVLRAYAGVNPTEDFNISIGPELILRDEGTGEDAATSEQPDSVFGLGMKFQYDF